MKQKVHRQKAIERRQKRKRDDNAPRTNLIIAQDKIRQDLGELGRDLRWYDRFHSAFVFCYSECSSNFFFSQTVVSQAV